MPVALSTMTAVAKAVKVTRIFFDKYPVTRGMGTFAVLWTSGNLLQQEIDDSRDQIDIMEAIRFGMYGSCINAPLIYKWIKTLTTIIPGNSLRQAIAKGYMDQLIFAPVNLTQFFIGMNLLEGKKLDQAVEECFEKLIPTWMVSISIWPIFQTINFTLIPEKNRVMFISLGSFLWMVFLSYMQHTDSDQLPDNLRMRRRIHYDYDYGALTEALQDALMEATPGEGFYPSQEKRQDYSKTAFCQEKNSLQTSIPKDFDFFVVKTDSQQQKNSRLK
ncbi:unnamed protein product, partial [Meganyctiphanes norvegica]